MNKIDPKVKNLSILFAKWVFGAALLILAYSYFAPEFNFYKFLWHAVASTVVIRLLVFLNRRYLQSPKLPSNCGKWAIIVDNGSQLSTEFAVHLAKSKMSLYLVSSAEEFITNKISHIFTKCNVQATCKVHNFNDKNTLDDEKFYEDFKVECQKMNEDGGIGIFVNHLEITQSYQRQKFDDLSYQDIEFILNSTIFPTVILTSIVFNHMKERANGCIVVISDSIGNHVAPFRAIYSSAQYVIKLTLRNLDAI